jgi:F0F1-type ATP synthase delta subunit
VDYVLSSGSRRILHESLMKELIEELKDMQLPENIRLEKGSLSVEVISAYALDEAYKQRIKEVLQKRLAKPDLEFDFKADQGIIGGLVLNFQCRVIDGSLRNRLRQAVALIQQKK